MSLSLGMTAGATGTNDNDELTEEELYAKQLQEIYDMPVQSNDIKKWPDGPGTYGEAAIVMEARSGAILYAKNIDEKHFPASITKVLTALVAVENGKLTDPVKMSHDSVAFLQPGDSSIGLKEGNEINLEQALYATLLASANEAAYTVAENVLPIEGRPQDHTEQGIRDSPTVRELQQLKELHPGTKEKHSKRHWAAAFWERKAPKAAQQHRNQHIA